jgi:Ataxin-1 and HBP1 module (AXH)
MICTCTEHKPVIMKSLPVVFVLVTLLFSCSKSESPAVTDCSHFNNQQAPVTCSGTISPSDTAVTYMNIWKGLFLARNQMSDDYFSKHITICSSAVYRYASQGYQYEITYKYTVDWFEARFDEGFMIWLYPAYLQSNPDIRLPDSILLSRDQIAAYSSNAFFADPINAIASVDHLNYSTSQEAIQAMAAAAGTNTMCGSRLSVQYQDDKNIPIGHPMMTAEAATDWKANLCVGGEMDLSTAYITTSEYACIISFCFASGTSISTGNNQSRTIEKIRPGDRILSFSFLTGKPEPDTVTGIDSVKHRNLVRITFSDLTASENTADHPYWVKNKGWCAVNPASALRNNGIRVQPLIPGDTCLKLTGNHISELTVKSITGLTGEAMTYNISHLQKFHSWFANGILVSDESKGSVRR